MNEHFRPPETIKEIDEDNFDEWVRAVRRSAETAIQEAMDREDAETSALIVEIQALPEQQQRERLKASQKRQTALRETVARLAAMRDVLTIPYNQLIARAQMITKTRDNRDVDVNELSVQENRVLQQHEGIARAERAVAQELRDVERDIDICTAVINGLRLQIPAEA